MSKEEFAERFPIEVREAAKNISSDNHFAVLALLIEEGGLSFNQIRDELDDLHQQSLSNTLEQLQEGGFVVRRQLITSPTDYSTRYIVTELGMRILEGLLEAFTPRTLESMVIVEAASGHEYHTQENPYPVKIKNSHSVNLQSLEEASKQGGIEGEHVKNRIGIAP